MTLEVGLHRRDAATPREREAAVSVAERLVQTYDPSFRARMTVPLSDVGNPDALVAAMATLSPEASDLIETLLVGVGAGEAVPPRFQQAIDLDGEELWLAALLLPRAAPSPGATVDPRYHSASSRLNPALAGYRPLPELRTDRDFPAHPPPSDALWDAVVVAALLEASPAAVTRDGRMRRDTERRILRSLGEDEERWTLALAMARATGLVREAAGRLYGRPESAPRKLPLLDPSLVLDADPALAASALLRLVDTRWIPMELLLSVLQRRCPDVLSSDHGLPFHRKEAQWLQEAASVLHRAGLIDASVGPNGVEAVRVAAPRAPRSQGLFLTPDRDILVAPGELGGADYGRLCRVAPYVDGDVVHRHRLTREGVAADIAAGHDQLVEWLASLSRTGMPHTVRAVLEQWAASAVRVTLLTGVNLLEENGQFRILAGHIPARARVLEYGDLDPPRFQVVGDEVRVRFGEDLLTLRSVIDRVGRRLPPSGNAWRWAIGPQPTADPDHLLDRLRRFCEGPVPGALEAAIHAAGGRSDCRFEAAVVIHVPPEAAEALARDEVASPMLNRPLRPGQWVVDAADRPALARRLAALGFHTDGEGEF